MTMSLSELVPLVVPMDWLDDQPAKQKLRIALRYGALHQ